MNGFQSLPFPLEKGDNFFDKLNEWIGDVFYDILPENGFEERDEQIFMAFQLERAFKEKNVIFAEAGVGTGKTIVYLLYSICYARYIGKPAVIACADETLIEQLVKDEGDIQKLSNVLGFKIDVRLAKSQNNYLCLQKLEDAMLDDEEYVEEVHDSLPDFVHDYSTLKSFYPYGDRKQYPHLSDQQWDKISWDYFQDCIACDKRHRCGLTLNRDYYRKAADLIVCSQDFFMEHIWTKESRQREGQLPLLPEYSCVVFDEGHLVEFAAQKALTYRVKEHTLEMLLERLLQNDVREELAQLLETTITENERFFDCLAGNISSVEGSHRMDVNLDAELLKRAKRLSHFYEEIGDALVFERELYVLDEYEVNVVDEYLDFADYSMRLLAKETGVITWAEEEDGALTLVIMPRTVESVLQEKVFKKKMPIVFSSATMSEENEFTYMSRSLGINNYLSFSVESPFDYDENMKVFLNRGLTEEEKYEQAVQKLRGNDGATLILFPNRKAQRAFQRKFKDETFNHPFYFEGDSEISELVRSFQNDTRSCLASYSLWEGLDIPGESLTQLIIWDLPYPPNDPVFQAKRKAVDSPHEKVDVPYMLLRLRQGIGRLIRTTSDYGQVYVFVDENVTTTDLNKVIATFPVKPE